MIYDINFPEGTDPWNQERTARQIAHDVHTHPEYEKGIAMKLPVGWVLGAEPEISAEHKERLRITHNVTLTPRYAKA